MNCALGSLPPRGERGPIARGQVTCLKFGLVTGRSPLRSWVPLRGGVKEKHENLSLSRCPYQMWYKVPQVKIHYLKDDNTDRANTSFAPTVGMRTHPTENR